MSVGNFSNLKLVNMENNSKIKEIGMTRRPDNCNTLKYSCNNNLNCANECDGFINLILNGFIEEPQITWSSNVSGQTGESLEDLCPGIYSVTVNDSENECDHDTDDTRSRMSHVSNNPEGSYSKAKRCEQTTIEECKRVLCFQHPHGTRCVYCCQGMCMQH